MIWILEIISNTICKSFELAKEKWLLISNKIIYFRFTKISSGLEQFIQHAFKLGLSQENTNKMNDKLFNLSLDIFSNLMSSKFIETKLFGTAKYKTVSQLITSFASIISTIPVENIHVR